VNRSLFKLRKLYGRHLEKSEYMYQALICRGDVVPRLDPALWIPAMALDKTATFENYEDYDEDRLPSSDSDGEYPSDASIPADMLRGGPRP
jgi:hypothetical protein